MEDGNLTTALGAAGAANHLISGQPCTLLGIWFDNAGTDPSVFPLVIEIVDEAATADIDASSKILYRKTIADPAGRIEQLNFAIKTGKGLCVKLPALGTNASIIGLTWR